MRHATNLTARHGEFKANPRRHFHFIDKLAGAGGNNGHASGAWFIGPDGATLAQMPASAVRADSKDFS